jgi:DNA-directed RNA polymerase specialized sigma24 family protein
MFKGFTEEDRQKEVNRLHEAWLRDQSSMKKERRETRENLTAEIRRRKKAEAELKKGEKRFVIALREAGYSDKRIAEILDMPEDRVKTANRE